MVRHPVEEEGTEHPQEEEEDTVHLQVDMGHHLPEDLQEDMVAGLRLLVVIVVGLLLALILNFGAGSAPSTQTDRAQSVQLSWKGRSSTETGLLSTWIPSSF
eukprot:GHVO01048332.1.p3 GENE.GHVO01048332.1~~GHVO01048332.1.p3  ORF type:complete len:102 (+),score=15.31 GHVO01048332.1:118-423(+)